MAGAIGLAGALLAVLGGLTGLASLLAGTVGGVPVPRLHQVVDIVSWAVAVLAAPVLMSALLLGVAGVSVWSRAALRRLGGLYAPLLVVVAVTSGVAVGLWRLTALGGGAVWLVVRGVGLAVVVGVGLCVALTVFSRGSQSGRRFLLPYPPKHAARPAWPFGVALSPIRRLATGSVALVVGLALILGMGPSGVAHADPGSPSPSPVVSATPQPGGPATNTAPVDNTSSESALRDPQPYYQTPTPPGPVVSADAGSVTYQTGPRSYQTVLGGVQTTYTDADGNTQLVDNTLAPNNDNGTVSFTNAANDFQVSIPAVMDQDHGLVFARSGYELELIPTSGDYSKPVAKGNAILFNDVYPGIDVQYTLIGSVIKEDIVVNHLVTVPDFSFTVKADSGLAVGSEAAGTLAARASRSSGDVASGDVVFALVAPAMIDGAGVVSSGLSMATAGSGASATATISVDQSWLADPARVFPVRIDPTVDIAPAAVTLVGVEQGAPNMSIGDNGYPYSGYDDGVTSGNIGAFNTLHMMTRTWVGINYDFQSIMREAKIDSATFDMYQLTNWGPHAQPGFAPALFDLYTADNAWSPSTMTWNSQLADASMTFVGEQPASYANGLHWDVREVVNNWVQGIVPANGFVIKAQDERWMQAEVFENKASSKPPSLTINWSIPDPVDPNYPLNSVTANVRPVTEKTTAGELIVDGVFADGLAQPDSVVQYVLQPDGLGATQQASRSYKYPNSSDWDASFPDAYKFSDKLSNWQTGLFPASMLTQDSTYQFQAQATMGGVASTVAESDKFLIYKVKATDTLPFIAKWYGVPVTTLMADNHVQDTLAVADNTLFIRNPNTTVPYNPGPLTDEQKKQIDSNLMGRGMHCEYGFEPVNLDTGDFWLQAQDVAIPDVGTDFTLTRSYNSLGQPVNSVFGWGWQFDYSEYLVSGGGGTLLYTTSDGKTLTFTPNGDGTYSSPEGFNETITAVPYTVGTDTFTKYHMTAADGSAKDFNAWGLLSGVTGANGLATTLTYDANFNLTTVTSPSGLTLTLTYDQNGRVTSVTRPDGIVLTYTYDAQGNLVSFTDGNGNPVTYAYDAAHRMTSWTDQNGDTVVSNTFDDLGRVVKQSDANHGTSTMAYTAGQTVSTDALGNSTTYTLDDQQRTTGIRYPDGTTVARTYGADNTLASDENGTYTYDAQGNMLTSTDVMGRTTTYTYNSDNQVKSATDAAGLVTSYTYNAGGDLTSKTVAGSTDAYTWDSEHRLVSHTNPVGGTESYTYVGTSAVPATHIDLTGGVTTYVYTQLNQIGTVTDPAGGVTRYMWDQAGNRTGAQTPDGGTTKYVYDKVGDPIQSIDPNGHATSFTYDPARNLTSATDPNGNTTTYTYDADNNLVSETNPLKATTTYTYDAMNQMTSFTAANGGVWAYTYDSHGNIVSATDPTGAVTAYTYDPAFGTVLAKTDPDGGVTANTYTPTGKLLTTTDAAGNTNTDTYGANGQIATMTDPTGQVTTLTYDAAGNVTSIDVNGRTTGYTYNKAGQLVSSVDTAGKTAAYTYDALGRAASVTDEAGRTTSYLYDGNGRVVQVTDPTGAITKATHDAAGNMLTETDANGNTTSFAYDAMNHLVAVTDALGQVTSFTYDAAENLTSATNPYKATAAYSFDAQGNMTSMTDPLGRTMTYTYDPLNRVTSVTDPAGNTVTTSYTDMGQASQVKLPNGLTTDYTYDALGNMVKATTSNGAKTTYTYDADSRLLTTTDPVGQTARQSYDVWGEVISQTGTDQVTTDYTYDKLGNVVKSANTASGTTSYTRDAAGNITSQTDPLGNTTVYTYDQAGRLLSQTDPLGAVTTYTYDAQGNLVDAVDALKGDTSFTYDALNRATSMTDPNGGTTKYAFDALNQLVAVTQPAGDVTKYAYDAAGELATTTNGIGQTTAYGYDPRGLLTSVTDPNKAVTQYQYDGQGNMTASTDPLGRVTSYGYDQAGRMTSMTNPADGQYLYAYDQADRLTSVTSPLGYKRTLTYDQAGNITTERDNLGRVNTYTWDSLHNLTQSTDAAGSVSSFTYDPLGQMLTATNAMDGTWSYTYDANGHVTAQTNPLGQTTTAAYDLLGRVTSTATPSGAATTYSYDKNSNLTSVTDPLGNTTTSTYDADNRITSQTDPLKATTAWAWNAASQVTAVTSQTGGTTGFAYDNAGNLVKVTDPNQNTTKYVYDKANQVTSATDGTGNTSSYTYDKLGDVATITDATGNTTSLTYDQVGNLTSVTDPLNQVEKWTYDPASRLTSDVKPGGMTAKYDYSAIDNLVKTSFAATPTQDVAYTYNALGQRSTMTDQTGTSTYTRDALGRLTSVTQGDGHTLTYTYTDDGQVASITYPDASVVKYGYDDAGNLVTVADTSGTSTYAYDADNRVVSLTRPGGMATLYGYDQAGQVTALINTAPDGTVLSRFDYTYDLAGQVSTETQTATDDQATWTQVDRTFTYDNANRLLSYTQTDPVTVDQPDDSIDGNTQGSSAAVTPVAAATVTGFAPFAATIPAKTATPLPAAATMVTTTTYTYDASGNRATATVTTPGDVTQEKIAYTYDANNQLVKADSTLNGVTTYAWSPTGDLLTATNTDTGVVDYTWTVTDRLQAVHTGGRLLMAASYDGDGNLVFQATSRPVTATGAYAVTGGSVFAWTDDQFNATPAGLFWYGFATQVAQAALGVDTGLSVAALDAIHNGFGTVSIPISGGTGLDQDDTDSLQNAGLTPSDVSDLVTGITTQLPDAKNSTSQVTGFTYDLAHYVNNVNTQYPQIVADYGASGSLTANYTYGQDLLNVNATGNSDSTNWLMGTNLAAGTAALSGGETGWYLPDGQGNVAQVATGTGDIVTQSAVDPWGANTSTTATWGSPQFGYQSQLTDPNVGLQYLRARWYEPTTGRFISQDPTMGSTLNPLSLNRYTYAWSNPTNMSDPSGYWPAWLNKAVSAVGNAVSSAVHTVTSAVSTAATWVNNNVVKPVVNTVKAAATWVNNNVVQPVVGAVKTAASWVNNNIIQPAAHAVSNAVNTVVNTAVSIAQQAKTAVGAMASAAVVAYRSTTQYIAQKTAEAKAELAKFVCTTKNVLTNAWEKYVPESIQNLPWGTIGKVAMMVGGAALTIATLGAAGPVVGAIMVGALVVNTGIEVNDMVADATGKNFIKDTICSGNAACYTGIEIGGAVLGMVGPTGAAGAAKAADAAADAEKAAKAAAEAGDAAKAASAATDAEKAATAAADANKATDAASTTKLEDAACALRSFTAATMVLMADGTREPIADVQVGDKVTSFDPGTGEQSVQTVTATWPHTDTVVTLTLGDGTVVETTASHPWWDVTTRTYTRTDHLAVGDRLLTADGSTLTVAGMSGPQGEQQVYNLTITGPHTFYVGDTEILVHNCGTDISNDVLDTTRAGHALQGDAYHAFPDIVDNYAGLAQTSSVNNGTLYQLAGSLNGVEGRFEWIIDTAGEYAGQVSHRLFVPGGTITGVPIKP